MDFSIGLWRYIMKKIIAIGVILILLVVGGSYLMSHPINPNGGEDLSQQSVEYSENGITLLMPGNWVSAESQSNDTVLAVADPDSKDSSGFNSVNVNIEKRSSTRNLESEFNSNYNNLARNTNFNILFEGNATFNGEEAMEADYTDESSDELKEHKAIWIKRDSDIYVILCSAPESEFEERLSTFDFIINNVKI